MMVILPDVDDSHSNGLLDVAGIITVSGYNDGISNELFSVIA